MLRSATDVYQACAIAWATYAAQRRLVFNEKTKNGCIKLTQRGVQIASSIDREIPPEKRIVSIHSNIRQPITAEAALLTTQVATPTTHRLLDRANYMYCDYQLLPNTSAMSVVVKRGVDTSLQITQDGSLLKSNH